MEKESSIQSTIIDYLFLKKHFFVRLNNIPPVQKIGGKMVFRRMPKGSVKGLPDLMVLLDTGVVFLELKSEKGKLSKEQKEFQSKCKERGIEYYEIRSLDQVRELGL